MNLDNYKLASPYDNEDTCFYCECEVSAGEKICEACVEEQRADANRD